MSDEDEYQPQDEDDPDSWNEDVRQRREELFKEDDANDVEEAVARNKRQRQQREEEERQRQEDDLRAQIDTDMNEWASEVMARNLAIDRQVPPPAKPRIESDFSAFQSSPVRPIEPEKQQGRISKSNKPCPTATLRCETVAASRTKCGWGDDTHGGIDPILGFTHFIPDPTLCSPCGTAGAIDDTMVGDPAATCTPGQVFLKMTTTQVGCDSCTDPVASCLTCPDSGNTSGTKVVVDTYDGNSQGFCNHTANTTGSLTCVACDGVTPCADAGLGNCVRQDILFENEYTTATLKSQVIAALPGWTGTFIEFCPGAVYDLSSSEMSFTLQRCKYKIHLSGAACAGMIVTWNEHFQPTPSGSPTDTAKTWTAAGGETETPVYTIPDPTSNAIITITNIVVDCSSCTDLVTYQNIEFDA